MQVLDIYLIKVLLEYQNSKIVNTFAKRLQTQEIMTSQIINAIHDNLNPIGVGVVIEADHHCMKTRGVHKKFFDDNFTFKGSFN